MLVKQLSRITNLHRLSIYSWNISLKSWFVFAEKIFNKSWVVAICYFTMAAIAICANKNTAVKLLRRNERALTFEKVGASDMQLAPTWTVVPKKIHQFSMIGRKWLLPDMKSARAFWTFQKRLSKILSPIQKDTPFFQWLVENDYYQTQNQRRCFGLSKKTSPI